MLDNSKQPAIAFTDASFTQTRGSRPNIVTGAVLYAHEKKGLSGFIMNLQRFSLMGSDAAETLTSVLAIALAPDEYSLTSLYTDCRPSVKRLEQFQALDTDVKGLTPEFRLKAHAKISEQSVTFQSDFREVKLLKFAHHLAKKGKLIRDGVVGVSFIDGLQPIEGQHMSWNDLSR